MTPFVIAVVIGAIFGLILALVMRSRARGEAAGKTKPERGLRSRPIPTKPEPTAPPGKPSADTAPAPAKPAPPAAKRAPSKPAAVKGDGLGSRIRALFAGKQATAEEWSRLEDLLIRADVGPTAAKLLVERVRERYEDGSSDPAALMSEEIAGVLGGDNDLHLKPGELSVIMVVGVNGAGKSTTIGKLAALLGQQGLKVGLANSDTFRAAAGEQLTIWAQRSGAHIVTQTRGADPGAVAFDAVQSAKARGDDVLIVDTAGRLHTRQPLMAELEKVKRVLEKAAGDIEDILLVIDATTGQNGIAQAREFTKAVPLTGVALTKLDGTAKGGIVLAVREELDVPVKLVGTGEQVGDLQPFDPRAFADNLLAG
ncbi:MAG TPA: signal recognition particle-docking protein FtsY [Actinomycetota bacterium]|nr:signal recognition particle-docking protein FtsY [Actinomycetota bacterium]